MWNAKKTKWAHRFGALPPNDQLFPSCDSQINSFPSPAATTTTDGKTVRTPLPTTGCSNGRLKTSHLHGICWRVIHNSYSQRPFCSFSLSYLSHKVLLTDEMSRPNILFLTMIQIRRKVRNSQSVSQDFHYFLASKTWRFAPITAPSLRSFTS